MVLVDVSDDRLYALNAAGITIIPDASTASGTPAPSVRAIAPNGSTFQAIAVKP